MKTGLLTIILLILLSAGCVLKPANVRTEKSAASDDCKQRTIYFRDEVEPDAASGGGDRPAIAGCHVSYSDSNCTSNRDVYAGDECSGSGVNVKLVEWTDGQCHKSSTVTIDRKRYDCNAWCISKGHAAGECKKTVDGVCGTKSSAYRKCTGATRPTEIEQ